MKQATREQELVDAVKLIEHFFELPLREQVGAVRAVVPEVLARLAREERDGLLRDLRAGPHDASGRQPL